MNILAFAFTRLEVSDLDAAERFYRAVFDMQVTRRVQAVHASYSLEETILTFTPGASSTALVLTRFQDRPASQAGAAWVGFMVSDIEETARQIVIAGGKVLVPVHGTPAEGVKSLHASDLDGHKIAVIQVLAKP